MWWECSECGACVDEPCAPSLCPECGLAALFVATDDVMPAMPDEAALGQLWALGGLQGEMSFQHEGTL